MSAAVLARSARVLRHSPRDAILVGLSVVHAALLLTVPSIGLVALGLWWNANTIAHNFIHLPFFRARWMNRAFAGWLTLVLGVPQSVWRERHLAHHADRAPRVRLTPALAVDVILLAALWTTLAVVAPHTFTGVYLPGCALGLGLCFLQGHYEHARGTTSHYGRLYNLLFFNDGLHAEHHARPGVHWSHLASAAPGQAGDRSSRWPPVLRWLDTFTLEGLERLVLRSPILQRLVVRAHARAFSRLLAGRRDIRTVVIVGGGLFPRTAIVLRTVLPDAAVTIVDVRAEHLDAARRFLDPRVVLRHELYAGAFEPAVDLLVVPLSYVGDRARLYANPPARLVIVHDWLWSRRGESAIVSRWLLKRANLIAAPRQVVEGARRIA